LSPDKMMLTQMIEPSAAQKAGDVNSIADSDLDCGLAMQTPAARRRAAR
jgi:hypothetical protein